MTNRPIVISLFNNAWIYCGYNLIRQTIRLGTECNLSAPRRKIWRMSTSYGWIWWCLLPSLLFNERVCIPDEGCSPTGQQYPLSEMLKAVWTEARSIEALDLLVEALAGSVGFFVLKTIVDVSSVMPDGFGCMFNLVDTTVQIGFQPVCEHQPLNIEWLLGKYIVELL